MKGSKHQYITLLLTFLLHAETVQYVQYVCQTEQYVCQTVQHVCQTSVKKDGVNICPI